MALVAGLLRLGLWEHAVEAVRSLRFRLARPFARCTAGEYTANFLIPARLHVMTSAAALILLGTPGLWTCVNLDPLTICQTTNDVCVTASPHELLVVERDAETITVTPLRGEVADVAWNLIVLRAADAMAQAERARRGRMKAAQ